MRVLVCLNHFTDYDTSQNICGSIMNPLTDNELEALLKSLNQTEPSAKKLGLGMRRKKARKRFVPLLTTCQTIKTRCAFCRRG